MKHFIFKFQGDRTAALPQNDPKSRPSVLPRVHLQQRRYKESLRSLRWGGEILRFIIKKQKMFTALTFWINFTASSVSAGMFRHQRSTLARDSIYLQRNVCLLLSVSSLRIHKNWNFFFPLQQHGRAATTYQRRLPDPFISSPRFQSFAHNFWRCRKGY